MPKSVVCKDIKLLSILNWCFYEKLHNVTGIPFWMNRKYPCPTRRSDFLMFESVLKCLQLETPNPDPNVSLVVWKEAEPQLLGFQRREMGWRNIASLNLFKKKKLPVLKSSVLILPHADYTPEHMTFTLKNNTTSLCHIIILSVVAVASDRITVAWQKALLLRKSECQNSQRKYLYDQQSQCSRQIIRIEGGKNISSDKGNVTC